jgi:DNA-binding response OmpR family regulator
MEKPNRLLSGKRVLIAEDEPVVALDYAAMLSAAGAEIVATARTAAEAIEHVQRVHVDAVVLDFVLADRNSSSLQVVLKEKGIPFVVVSGYPPVLVRGSGDQHVLHKPVTADLLCAAVLAACDRSGEGRVATTEAKPS